MRIVAGKYKGRRLSVALPDGIRPTTDSLRETIFNILLNYCDIDETRVLDLFSGSGFLGFEALSRGAQFCSFIDISSGSLAIIKKFAADLKLDDSCFELVRSDAIQFLKKFRKQEIVSGKSLPPFHYDIVFLDPPYLRGLCNHSLALIAEYEILKKGGIAVVEVGSAEGVVIPEGFSLLKNRVSGQTQTFILNYEL